MQEFFQEYVGNFPTKLQYLVVFLITFKFAGILPGLCGKISYKRGILPGLRRNISYKTTISCRLFNYFQICRNSSRIMWEISYKTTIPCRFFITFKFAGILPGYVGKFPTKQEFFQDYVGIFPTKLQYLVVFLITFKFAEFFQDYVGIFPTKLQHLFNYFQIYRNSSRIMWENFLPNYNFKFAGILPGLCRKISYKIKNMWEIILQNCHIFQLCRNPSDIM